MLIRWPDRVFLSTTLRAESWGRRFSWRFGRWLHRVAVTVHEGAWVIGARLGPARPGRAEVERARGTGPPGGPRYPSFFASRPAGRADAQELVAGERVLSTGQRVSIGTVSWRRDPFGDASSLDRLLFHSLDWVEALIEAHDASGDARYLDAAADLARRWIDECLLTERSDEVWSDHATAIRAVVLCRLWCRSGGDGAAGAGARLADRDLLAALVRHGARLAHPAFYRPDHNHGVTQAYGLLAVGLTVPSLPESAAWVRLARARLESQMAENVSEEGIHREHSPYYHFYVYRQFQDACRLAAAGGAAFSAAYRSRLEKCLLAGSRLIKPNGLLTALGDTSVASQILADEAELSLAAGGARPGGPRADGTSGAAHDPERRCLLSPGAGLAVLESGPGETGPSSGPAYLAFRLGTQPTSHVHRDVFTFEYFACGGDLLVDSGGPYVYGEPLREYFASTRAHNTVTVDDGDQGIGSARLLHWNASPGRAVISAEHSNYAGVAHRRILAFGRGRYVLVVDLLRSGTSHTYRQLFHLGPDLDGTLEGLSATGARRGGGPALRVIPLLSAGISVRIRHGETRPHQGWVCTGERRMIPNGVIEYETEGPDAAFVALLVPVPGGTGGIVPDASLEGDPLRGGCRVRVALEGVRDDLRVHEDGSVAWGGA